MPRQRTEYSCTIQAVYGRALEGFLKVLRHGPSLDGTNKLPLLSLQADVNNGGN
jgi:hypothetical protein